MKIPDQQPLIIIPFIANETDSEYWTGIWTDLRNNWLCEQFNENINIHYSIFIIKMKLFEVYRIEEFNKYCNEILSYYYIDLKSNVILNEIQILYAIGLSDCIKQSSILFEIFLNK